MTTEQLTKAEAAYISGVPAGAVDRAIDKLRVGRPFVTRAQRKRLLTPKGAFLIAADHQVAGTLAPSSRRKLLDAVKSVLADRPISAVGPIVLGGGFVVPLTVDLAPLAREVSSRLDRYQRALELIVEDPEVQAGAPTLKGTRVLVRPVAKALERGVPAAELMEDYDLSLEQIEAARIYAAARPARGRPTSRGAQEAAGGRARTSA
jgi:uncharacterized protein (DUF433 family)